MAADKIIRKAKNRQNPYSMISNAMINDSRLSWKARGLMTYILSKPDDWCVYVSQLANESSDGRESVETGIDELRYHGYISLVCYRNEKGQVTSWEYVVYEEPIEVSDEERAKIDQKRANKKARENRKAQKRKNANVNIKKPETGSPDVAIHPETGSPDLGSPDLGNPQLLNTDLTKKRFKQKTDNNIDPAVAEIQNEIQTHLGTSIESLLPLLTIWIQKYGERVMVDTARYIGANRSKWDNIIGAYRAAITSNWSINEISATIERDGRYANFYKLFPES